MKLTINTKDLLEYSSPNCVIVYEALKYWSKDNGGYLEKSIEMMGRDLCMQKNLVHRMVRELIKKGKVVMLDRGYGNAPASYQIKGGDDDNQ